MPRETCLRTTTSARPSPSMSVTVRAAELLVSVSSAAVRTAKSRRKVGCSANASGALPVDVQAILERGDDILAAVAVGVGDGQRREGVGDVEGCAPRRRGRSRAVAAAAAVHGHRQPRDRRRRRPGGGRRAARRGRASGIGAPPAPRARGPGRPGAARRAPAGTRRCGSVTSVAGARRAARAGCAPSRPRG